VDRSDKFWQKCLRRYIEARRQGFPPWRGLPLPQGRACVNCSRDSTIRGMREVGGLIVRRECSHSQGSARFARSLDELMARIETYRALLNIRDMRAGGLLEREREARCQAICCHTPNNIINTCIYMLQNVKRTVRRWKQWTILRRERVV